jgi:hypothetical protein
MKPRMRNIILVGSLVLALFGCERTRAPERSAAAVPTKRLFLDVHHVGPGKVTAEAVAGAHQKDLAVQAKYGVELQTYWLDEKQGNIYCLARAPSAEAVNAMHKEAHGLLADQIEEVSQGH